VRPRRVYLVSGLASAALHAIPLLFLVAPPSLRWPEPPIAIEVRPAHRAVPKQAPPQVGDPKASEKPAPPAKHSSTGKRPAKPKPGPGIAPPAAIPPPPPATADLQKFAPGDSKIVVLLRTDRLRKSPYKDGVQALLEALPDGNTLLAGTGLTPLDDFDALLIATANPFDVTATFLAARHADDNRVRAAMQKRVMPAWDPRVFRFLNPKLSVLVRPDGATRIDGSAIPDGGVDEDRVKWLEELARFDRIADEPGGPSMMVTVSDLGSLVQLQAGLPTPLAAAVAVTSDASPSLRIHLVFADPTQAGSFAEQWPGIVQRWRSQALLLGLGPMLDGLSVKRENETVEIVGQIPETQMRLALNWIKALLPQRPVVVEESPDAGSPDALPQTPVDSGAR
jgi:hypothetical protein